MTALDTNVLVRLIARDDPEQAERAAALVRASPCWIPLTVLMETEWVLRAVYGYGPAELDQAFRLLLSMRHVTVEDATRTQRALAWHLAGLDFSDALHLAGSQGKTRFASFDARLRQRSARVGAEPVVTEP